MRTIDLFEEMEDNNLTLIDALRDFLPLACKHLHLPGIPKIKLEKHIDKSNVPTFGRFTNEDDTVYVAVANRNPNDILRTLAHELQHFKQRTEHELSGGSWHTGSPAENQAHEMAGIIMREFNAKYPQYLRMKPVILPDNAPSKELDESDSVLTHSGFRETADIKTRDDFLGKRDELYRRLGDEKDPENLKALRQELRNLERLYPSYANKKLAEKWSAKYKRSIDCSHPKGFSQKAHCAGRKKK